MHRQLTGGPFMFKYRRPLWIGALCFGCLSGIISLVFLIWGAAAGKLHLISGIVLGLLVLGSVLFILISLKALLHLPQEVDESSPRKVRDAALATQETLRGKTDHWFSRALSVFVLLLAGFIFIMLYAKAQAVTSIPHSSEVSGTSFARAKVLSIVEEEYQGDQEMEDVPIGKQTVNVEITDGELAGRQYTLVNTASYLDGVVVKPGDYVTVSYSAADGEIQIDPTVHDFNRTQPLIIVLIIFMAITILVGGKVGAKSLLGLAFTILCIFTLLIPLLIGGAPTLPAVWAMCAYVTIVTFVILDGVNRKTVCAIFGTILGVAFAALFGKFFGWLVRVSGYQMRYNDDAINALKEIRQGQNMDGVPAIYLKDLLTGGILISALGAVNDVAMSISSAMNELIKVNPNLSRKELFKSGMNIGRDMVGTMTNTLILALVGGGFITMIHISTIPASLNKFMSTPFLAIEVVQAITSSLSVILGVPASVVLGVMLFGPQHRKKQAGNK